MSYDEIPLISSSALFRRAGVTPYHGQRVRDQLASEGRISPALTGTGRSLLTPRDGRLLFEALTRAA